MSADTEAINKIHQEYADAVSAGDPDRWIKIFVTDAVYMAPDLPVVKGRESILKWAKESWFSQFRMKETARLDELQVAGTWALGRGGFRISATPVSGGTTLEGTGKHIAVFRKDSGGAWKWAEVIFNWDKPLAAPSHQGNKEVIERWGDILSNGKLDLDLLDDFVVGDYVYHGPNSGLEFRGRDALKQMIASFRAGFPDMRASIAEMVAEGDFVATRWMLSGTHLGEFMGVAPTGRPVAMPILTITRFVGGKAAEDWETFDVGGLVQQLTAGTAGSPAT